MGGEGEKTQNVYKDMEENHEKEIGEKNRQEMETKIGITITEK